MLNSWKNKKQKSAPRKPAPLQEGKDFYIENGFYVFTAHFHLKRGHCCGNGCRHCPYNFEQKAFSAIRHKDWFWA